MKKVAFFVDWDNLRYILQKIKKDPAISKFDYNNSSHIAKLFNNFLEENEELYRIFFYTAKPLTDDEIRNQLRGRDRQRRFDRYSASRPNLVYNRATGFLNDIVKEDFIALRSGKMQVRDVDGNGRPEIVQKQVDMLIGLDISEVSFKKLADTILVFSKDTDMIPALKTARMNGLTVILANFDEEDYLATDLIVHSDLVRSKSLQQLDANL